MNSVDITTKELCQKLIKSSKVENARKTSITYTKQNLYDKLKTLEINYKTNMTKSELSILLIKYFMSNQK